MLRLQTCLTWAEAESTNEWSWPDAMEDAGDLDWPESMVHMLESPVSCQGGR